MASLVEDTGNSIKNKILGLINCKMLGNEVRPNQKTERAASDVE